MPPRKSDISKVGTGDEATPAKETVVVGVNVEDLNLPKSTITRLAKGVLPPNTQIQGNALLAITKSATVFINYLASHANEHAGSNARRTISPQDVLNALNDLEFAEFRPRLEAELAKYNELQADKRTANKLKQADSKAAAAKSTDGTNAGDIVAETKPETTDREGPPASKKARRDPDESELPDADDEPNDGDDGREDEPEEEDEEAGDEEVDEEEEGEDETREVGEEEEEEEDEGEGGDEALDNGEDSE